MLGGFLFSGCATTQEGIDYIGKLPNYAINAPHAKSCPCCSSQFNENSFEVKKDKKKSWLWHHLCHTGGMSIGKNARCSQIIKEVSNGKFVFNSKFKGYNPNNEVDRPSWDFRPRKEVQRKARGAGAWI